MRTYKKYTSMTLVAGIRTMVLNLFGLLSIRLEMEDMTWVQSNTTCHLVSRMSRMSKVSTGEMV